MGIVVFVRIIDRSCYFIRGKKLSLRVYCLIVKIEDNGREEKIDEMLQLAEKSRSKELASRLQQLVGNIKLKRLTRSNNKMIGGVCAGLAEYLDIDPTIVRIVWVLMVLFAGFGILLYIILWLIMPKQQIG